MTATMPKQTRTARLTKWIPKRWELWHSEAVLLSSAGMSNTDIAAKYDRTPQQISNILNTPQAAILRKQALDNLTKVAMGNMSERLEAITVKSVDRVQSLINNDKLFEESPFGVVDRAIKLLQGVGKLENEAKKGDIHNKINQAIILNASDSSDLLEGLRRDREVQQLHSGTEGGDVIHE